MHALDRLRRDSTGNVNLLLRILHLKPEPSNNTGHSTAQFSPGKVLANARTLSMQEGNLGKVRARTTILIRRLLPSSRISIDPAFREEVITG